MTEKLENIKAYYEGTLSPKERFLLEEEALNDPFLADALDGYLEMPLHSLDKASLLQHKLYAQIAKREEEKNAFGTTAHRLSIALIAAVILICVAVLFWFKKEQSLKKQRAQKEQGIEITLPKPIK